MLLLAVPALAQPIPGASNLKPIFSAPVKGLQTNISGLARSPENATVLNNLHQFQQGIWTSRGAGWTKERAGTFNSGGAFLEIAPPLTNADGTTTYFFQVGSKIYTYDFSTHTETQIGTGFGTTYAPCMRASGIFGTPYIIYCDGVNEPYYWYKGVAGNTLTVYGGFPSAWGGAFTFTKPKFVDVMVGSRAAFAGFTALPNTVLITDTSGTFTASSPQVATDAGYITVSPDLGPITGLRNVRLDNSTSILLVACARGMAAITGKDATDFRPIDLTRDFGVPSNRTWVEVQDTLYFLSTDGIRSFTRSDVSQSRFDLVSAGISDIANRISSTYASKAFAIKNPAKNEVVFWVPVDADTSPSHAIAMSYNIERSANEAPQPQLAFSTQDGISPTCGGYLGGVTYYGRSDGYLMVGYSGDTYDGTAINWEYMSPLIGGDTPGHNSSMRKCLILTDGTDQKFTARAYTLTQRNDGITGWIPQDSKSINLTSPSITTIGTWSSGTTTSYPKIIDFESRGSGRYWALRLTGSSTTDHISFSGLMFVMSNGGWSQ